MATKKQSKQPLVGIVMGSDSDHPVMAEAAKVLKNFGVPHEVLVASAHRSPARTQRYVQQAKKRGIQVLIAGAGGAAHLAGVIAAESISPVIGVPIDSSSLKGLDSLLATVQMPGGIPVATMAIGKAGAKNAGLLAVQILAVGNPTLSKKLHQFKKDQASEVEKKSRRVEKQHGKNSSF